MSRRRDLWHLCSSFNASKLHDHFAIPYDAQHLHANSSVKREDPVSFSRFLDESRGTTAVEFAITLPLFIMVIFGILECGFMLWTQLGLQHGTQMAARCASINASVCGNASATQLFAVQQAYGLPITADVFTVTTSSCGNQINASYTYTFLSSYFGSPAVTLTAQSCFPN